MIDIYINYCISEYKTNTVTACAEADKKTKEYRQHNYVTKLLGEIISLVPGESKYSTSFLSLLA